ncbi:MAG: methyltransferase domain-containing protein [Bacteroidia bacterium]|nr:methyltransferase domain-containing protein [Bacteroidia bacterium]
MSAKISDIRPGFKFRTNLSEIMDDHDLTGDILRAELDNLDTINRLLGGRGVVLDGIKKALKKIHNRPVNIADLGCGGGDILRVIAKWAAKEGVSVRLYGIDINETCILYAREKSSDYPEITFLQADSFSEDMPDRSYDIVICSLFLHHFSDTQLPQIFRHLLRISRSAVIVNDLQRHWLPFFLFRILTGVLRAPFVVRHDGLISIMRGFTRKELDDWMKVLNPKAWSIRWKWAFRYQLVFYRS